MRTGPRVRARSPSGRAVELGAERLSSRKGCRSAAELIERVTQASAFEARRRIALGSATRARAGFTGEPIEAQFPLVAAALAAGDLGADAASTIIRELDRTRPVADPVALATAEQALVAEATGHGDGAPVRATADELRVQAQAWSTFLDQDGREPDDERAMRHRGFRLGRARAGLIPVSGDLMPEVAAKLTRLLDAHLSPRSGTGFMTDDERASLAETGEQRTTDQQRHDVLAAVIDTAARSGEHPTIGGAAPTVLVSVRASDLAAGRGSAHADGIEIPISLRAARHMICTGGTQTVVFDDDGRIIELGSQERCFTPHQRRAITLRDGAMPHPRVFRSGRVVRDPPRHPRRRGRAHASRQRRAALLVPSPHDRFVGVGYSDGSRGAAHPTAELARSGWRLAPGDEVPDPIGGSPRASG